MSSVDVSEKFVSGGFFNVYLYNAPFEVSVSCSIKNLALASVSRLFAIKSDVIFPFLQVLISAILFFREINY